jgi:hypothetical protein
MSDITEFNVETKQTINRNYTDEEKAKIKAEQEAFALTGIVKMLDTSLKDSAIEKLKLLGLTEEEAKAIAGL